MNEFREWLNLFKENSGWVSTSILILSVFLGLLMRLNDYLNFNILCFYYDLNPEFYQYNEISIIFTIFLGLLLLGLIGSSIYCYNRLLESLKRRTVHNKISDIILFILFNFIVGVALYSSYCNVFVTIGATIGFQAIIILIFEKLKKIDKKYNAIQSKEEAIKKLKNFLKLIPWFTLIILVFTLIWNFLLYITKHDYQLIIHNNDSDVNVCEVIVYTTNEYFITLDCKIEQDNLIIYKGKQTKIKTDNVKIETIKFNSVIVE